MNIFINYAREDAISANRLHENLSAIPGVIPWLDSKNLLPGTRWKDEIMQALKRCDLCIILLSQHSVSKTGFVQKEIAEALEKLQSFPPDRIYIIPARLDDCHPSHKELNELQWVDMFPDWGNGFKLISKTIKKLKGEPIELPAVPDDVTIETITSEENLNIRRQARGNLRGCDAMELTLIGTQFHDLDCTGANFVRGVFKDCNFQNSNLTGVNFEGAKFDHCQLAGANLWGANFWGANLRGVQDLTEAVFGHTNFFRSKLTDKQADFIVDNANIICLPDYDSFQKYFAEELHMDKNTFSRTFIWINSRYFRLMYNEINNSFPYPK